MKKIFIAAAAVLALLAAAGSAFAAESHVDKIKASGVIRIGTSAYRPLQYRDHNNELVGYNVDLAHMLADKLGVKIEWVEIPFSGLAAGVRTGMVDAVLACIAPTTKGGETVSFSDSYLDDGPRLVVLESNNDIHGVEDLNGKRVGVKAAADSDRLADKFLEEGMKFEKLAYEKTEDYLLDLRNGRLDVCINFHTFQSDYNKEFPGVMKMVGDFLYGYAISMIAPKGDTELIAVMNELIRENKESGKAEELYNKWLR